MPELPEVEIVKKGLKRRIVGKKIRSIEVRWKKSFNEPKKIVDSFVVGAKVQDVRRYQKMVIIDLSSGWSLVVHLKMTGQLVYENKEARVKNQGLSFAGGHPEKAYEQSLPHKHTQVIFRFSDGGVLYFNDLRKFGWVRVFARKVKIQNSKHKSLEDFLLSFRYSSDPLTDKWAFEDFQERASKRSITIKQLLLDQRVVAGVGNIYADEALFCAKILPTRKTKKLTNRELKKIFECVRVVLEKGIKYGGTTKSDYRTSSGGQGGMQNHLKVYGREGEKCSNCKSIIKRVKLGGRSTHFCPACQDKQ